MQIKNAIDIVLTLLAYILFIFYLY